MKPTVIAAKIKILNSLLQSIDHIITNFGELLTLNELPFNIQISKFELTRLKENQAIFRQFLEKINEEFLALKRSQNSVFNTKLSASPESEANTDAVFSGLIAGIKKLSPPLVIYANSLELKIKELLLTKINADPNFRRFKKLIDKKPDEISMSFLRTYPGYYYTDERKIRETYQKIQWNINYLSTFEKRQVVYVETMERFWAEFSNKKLSPEISRHQNDFLLMIDQLHPISSLLTLCISIKNNIPKLTRETDELLEICQYAFDEEYKQQYSSTFGATTISKETSPRIRDLDSEDYDYYRNRFLSSS